MTARPSLEDLARFAAFVGEARSHADALAAYRAGGCEGRVPLADRLIGARDACRNRIMPEGQYTPSSPLMRLWRLVAQWPVLSLQGRLDHLPELAELVAMTEAAIAPPPAPPPATRFRADLDG